MRASAWRALLDSEFLRGDLEPGADWKVLLRVNLFPVIGLAVALLALVLLFLELFASGVESGTPVGRVYFKTGEARRKGQSRAVWTDVSVSFPVYNFDTIWTQAGAEAVLRLDKAGEIELGENTMVVLRIDPGQLNIDLSGGSVRSKQTEGEAAAIAITSGEKTISGNTEDVRVVASGNSVEVDVKAGQARVQSGQEEGQLVDGGSVAVLKGSLPAEVHRTLALQLAPADGATQDAGPVSFSWQRPPTPMQLQIASDAGFERILHQADGGNLVARMQLLPGVYYWRLFANAGQRTAARRLLIQSPIQLEAIFPADGATVRGPTGKIAVPFRWSGCPGYCQFVIGQGASLNPARSETVTGQSTTLALAPGRYYWQIRSTGAQAIVTPVRSFVAVEDAASAALELYRPTDGARFQRSELVSEGLLFRWAAGSASAFELHLRGPGAQERILTAAKPEFLLKEELLPGEYEWRVRPATSGAVYSRSQRFAIAHLPLQLLSPAPGQLFSTRSGLATVIFQWQVKERARYRLQAGTDPAFVQSALDQELDRSGQTFTPSAEGQYYWKVQALNAAGAVLGDSGTRSFLFYYQPGLARLIEPIRSVRVDMTGKDRLRFRWTAAERATHYRLRLLVPGRKSPVYLVQGTHFDLPDLTQLDRGFLQWEITALRRLPGTTVEGPPVRAAFEVFLENLGQPEFRVGGDGKLRKGLRESR